MTAKSRYLTAAAAAALLLAGGLAINTASPVLAASGPAAISQSIGSGVIISGAELQALAKTGKVKIVDVRGKKEYDKGHIPGAINLPWGRLNLSEVDGVRNELAPDAELAKHFSAAGLTQDDTVVLYDVTAFAGRAYVPFEYAGFSKLHVLDGGIANWKGEVTTAATEVKPSNFRIAAKRDSRVDQAYVASKVGSSEEVIIDGRNEDAYADGHIPSAKLIPATFYIDKQGQRRERAELIKDLSAKGLNADSKIVYYCGSGVAAANAYLFLKDLGFKNVALYDGSWDEWSRDPKAGQEVSLPNYSLASFGSAAGGLGPKLLSEAEVKELQKQPNTVVLDVRAPSDYRAGRIPNSVNVYWNDTLSAERELKSREDLEKLYRAQGVTPDKRIIVFTRGGLQATHTYTVLKLLGYDKVDVFAGKWEGWLNPAFTAL
ncbi:MAG: hypothetical protein KA106_04030 [Ferrovibrio sp.]|nr:hypothetical protein [Ferrovibrio sp.]